MLWSAQAVLADDLTASIPKVGERLKHQLGSCEPDLVLAFASPALDDAMVHQLTQTFPQAVLVGCAGSGVIGGHQELEHRSALSLTVAKLPNTQIRTAVVKSDSESVSPESLRVQLSYDEEEPALLIVLANREITEGSHLLKSLDTAFPTTVTVGGIAGSSVNRPPLLAEGRISDAGAVIVALNGGISAHSIVAQGCRPIGEPMLVTKANGHVIQELSQQRPLDMMRKIHDTLDPRDQELFQKSLFLGIEMKDQLEYQAGDFLIRNVLGLESKNGGLAVNVEVPLWKAVQFHLRDGQSSAEDLKSHLTRTKASVAASPSFALLFSCMGRGEGLYGEPSHDTRSIRSVFSDVPVGGFFCSGELGKIRQKTYIHGYTSSIALLCEPPPNDTL